MTLAWVADGAPRPLVSDAHRALCRACYAEAAHRAHLAMERAGERRSERWRVQHNARVRRWYQGRYVQIEEAP